MSAANTTDDVAGLATLLARKQDALDDAYSEIERLQHKVADIRHDARSATDRSAALEAEVATLRLRITSIDAETQQHKRTADFLNKLVVDKDSEFATYRHETSRQVSALQTDLDDALSVKGSLEKKLSIQSDRMKQLEDSNAELHARVADSDTKYHQMELQFKKEMDSMQQLCTLHKRDAENATARREEVERMVEDIRKRSIAQASEREEQVIALREEVETWRSKYSALAEGGNVDPDLGDTPRSAGKTGLAGISYTQLYAQYEDERSQRVMLERDLEVLSDRLDAAMLELQGKAPLLRELEESNAELTEKQERLLIQLAEEAEKRGMAERHADEAAGSVDELTAEKARLERDACDLAYQVVVLARQLNRGDIESSLQNYIARFNDEDASDIDQAITSRLVEVKSLEDLVQQNVSLRRLARTLAKECESKSKELEALSENSENAGKDQKLLEKISGLEAQLKLVNKQRADLQHALEHKIPLYEKRSPSRGLVREYSPSPAQNQGMDLAKDLQREYQALKEETDQTIYDLTNEVESLREKKLELSVKVVQLDTQLKYEQEKYASADQLSRKQMVDITDLRNKLVSLTRTQATNEAKIKELSDSYIQEKMKADAKALENNQLKLENELFSSNKARFMEDIKNLIAERNSITERANKLQERLEEVETFSRNERKRLQEKEDVAESELSSLRRKLQTSIEEHLSIVSSRDAEIKAYEARLGKLSVDLEKITNELSLVRSEEENSKKLITSLSTEKEFLQARIDDLEAKLESAATGTAEAQIRDLEKALKDSRKQFAQTLQDLESSKEREKNFRELASSSEAQLKEFSLAYDSYKADREKTIEDLNRQLQSLQMERDALSEQLTANMSEISESRNVLAKVKDEHENALNTIRKEMGILETRNAELMETFNTLKDDATKARELAHEAQAKYEHEVVAHSNALSTLQALRDSEGSSYRQIKEAEEKAKSAELALEQTEKSFKSTKLELESVIKEQDARIADLVQQNTILHSQFARIQEMQKASDNDKMSTEDQLRIVSSDETTKELQELVKLMRNDKDLLQSKLNVAVAENERVKMESSHLEASIASLRKRLEESSAQINRQVEFESKERELADSIEQANLLRESNITLRAQVRQSHERLKEATDKLAAIESEVAPLKMERSSLLAEIETRKEDNLSLLEDNKRWKDRVEHILKKYQRIDPQEHEELKSTNVELRDKNEKLTKDFAEIKAEMDKLQTQWASLSEVYEKDKAALNASVADVNALRESVAIKDREIEELKEAVSNPDKNEMVQKIRAEAAKQRTEVIQQANATLSKFKERNKALSDEIKTLRESEVALKDKIAGLEAEVQLIQNSNLAASESADANHEVQQIREQAETQKMNLEKQLSNAVDVIKQQQQQFEQKRTQFMQEYQGVIEKLRHELEQRQQIQMSLQSKLEQSQRQIQQLQQQLQQQPQQGQPGPTSAQLNSLTLKNKLLSDQLAREKAKSAELNLKILQLQRTQQTTPNQPVHSNAMPLATQSSPALPPVHPITTQPPPPLSSPILAKSPSPFGEVNFGSTSSAAIPIKRPDGTLIEIKRPDVSESTVGTVDGSRSPVVAELSVPSVPTPQTISKTTDVQTVTPPSPTVEQQAVSQPTEKVPTTETNTEVPSETVAEQTGGDTSGDVGGNVGGGEELVSADDDGEETGSVRSKRAREVGVEDAAFEPATKRESGEGA